MSVHEIPTEKLMDVAGLLDELGGDAMNELLKLDASMKAHLAPPTRTQQEIQQDSEQSCMVGCVSELPVTREQTGQYSSSMFCSFCAKRLIADDEDELSITWGEHLADHARAGSFQIERAIMR